MSARNIVFVALAIAIVILAIYLVIQFPKIWKNLGEKFLPELKSAHLQLRHLDAEHAVADLYMVIDNRAPVGFKLDSLSYTVFIGPYEAIKSTYPDSLQIKSKDTTAISLPLDIYYEKIGDVLKKYEDEGADSVIYRIDATLFTGIDAIPEGKINFSIDKKLPLIRVPEIKMKGFKIKKVNFSGATFQAEMIIANENVFPFGFRDMAYNIQFDSNQPIEGHKPDTIKIDPMDSLAFNFPLEINFGEMGKGLFELILKGGDLQYEFNLKAKLVSDSDILNDADVSLSAQGKLKELIKVAKEQIHEDKK